MKHFRLFFSTLALGTVLISTAIAQNYKAPAIDVSGKVTDSRGKNLGWVTKEGVIKDSAGVKIAHIDSEGSLVDAKTGKKLGKAEKNGNFAPLYPVTADDKWTVNEPESGMCEVKDKKGKTVVMVHENYKQYGACAYHCLAMKKEHKEMKIK